MSDGTNLLIRNDRGTSYSPLDSEEQIVDAVRSYIEQLERSCCPTSPDWLVERLRRLYGVEVDPSSVQVALEAPLRIKLGSSLRQRLG